MLTFVAAYPLCPVLVTSRKVGYRLAPVHGFPVFELKPFNDKEIREYVRRASQFIFRRSEEEAANAEVTFARGLSADARDLVSNPLLLSLMVWLHQERRGDLPNSRAEIYRECSLLMFQRWDEVREIRPEIPKWVELMDLLTYLASLIYLDPALAAGVSSDWLRRSIAAWMEPQLTEDKSARSRMAAKEVVDFITGRAWVMTDKGPDSYEFSHRTFLEYFFGRHLNDQNETVDALISTLVPKIANGEWNVPAHLAIQLKIAGRPTGVREMANKLLNELHTATTPKNSTEIATFLVQLLEYLPAPEPELERIAVYITHHTLTSSEWRKYFMRLIATSATRRVAIFRGVAQHVVGLFRKFDTRTVVKICDWIYAARIEARPGEIEPLNEFVAVFQKAVGPFLREKSDPAALVKCRFDMLDELHPHIEIFGARLWSSGPPYPRMGWLPTDLLLMLKELETFGRASHSKEELKYLKLAELVAPALLRDAPNEIPRPDSVHLLTMPALSWGPLLDQKGDSQLALTAATICLAYIDLLDFAPYDMCTEGFLPTENLRSIVFSVLQRLNSEQLTDRKSFFYRYREGKIRLFDRALSTSIG